MESSEKKSLYVLEGKSFFDAPVYYAGNWTDDCDIRHAKRYGLDEAMAVARHLRSFGSHYRCVRIEE